MVIIKPSKLLVCLLVLFTLTIVSVGWSYNGSDLLGAPGIQGDALSAEPRAKPSQQNRTRSATPLSVQSPSVQSQKTHTTRSGTSSAAPLGYAATPARPFGTPYQPNLFGSSCGPQSQGCGYYIPYLPRQGARQFQLDAKLWYEQLGSTVVWGTNLAGGKGTELDLQRDLDLSKYEYVAEYEARCQIRCNWGLRFSFMPIEYRDNTIPRYGFYFGNIWFPPGYSVLTKWNRNIYRWDIVYDWFQGPHAVSSIFAGYSLYDDKLAISNFAQNRARSRTFGLAYAGGSIDRVITTVGSGAASTHCKASVQFLEGYFGWDAYAAGRFAVPLGCGRFGYLEGGWRWIVLETYRPTNTDKTSMQGPIGAVGLVF